MRETGKGVTKVGGREGLFVSYNKYCSTFLSLTLLSREGPDGTLLGSRRSEVAVQRSEDKQEVVTNICRRMFCRKVTSLGHSNELRSMNYDGPHLSVVQWVGILEQRCDEGHPRGPFRWRKGRPTGPQDTELWGSLGNSRTRLDPEQIGGDPGLVS